jgi:shikimate kinase
LAERLGVVFRDSDDDVVAKAGKSITELFTDAGEEVFRAMEEEAIAAALSEHHGVFSLGGGAILSARTREILARHNVVFLNVGMAEGVRRVGLSSARPLLAGVNPRATYKALLDARLPMYQQVAKFVVDTDRRTPEEVTELIEKLLAGTSETSSA